MLIIRLFIFLFLVQVGSTSLFGQGWINTFGGPDITNDYDQGLQVDVDNNGNIFHLGHLYNGGIYNGQNVIDSLLPFGSPGFFIEKLDGSGNRIWRHVVSTTSYGLSFKRDGTGNIILVGRLNSKVILYSPTRIDSLIPQAATVAWPGGSFILKLNQQGDFVWIKEIDAQLTAFDIDPAGKIMLAGKAFGNVDINPGQGTTIVNGHPFDGTEFICQFDSFGLFEWAILHNIPTGTIRKMHIDQNMNVYLVGTFTYMNVLRPKPWQINKGGEDVFLRKMDSSRNFIWNKSFGGTGDDQVHSMEFDNHGNIYLTGKYWRTVDFDPSNNTYWLSAKKITSDYLLKLSNSGDFKWVKSIDQNVSSTRLAIASNEEIILSGSFKDTLFLDSLIKTTASSGTYDLFYGKLDTTGAILEYNQFSGAGTTVAWSTDVDDFGNLYFSGAYEYSADFKLVNNIPNVSYGRFDGFLLKVGTKTTSVSSFQSESKSFTVYPNPSNGTVNIKSGEELRRIQVYDIQGRLVQALEQPTKQIELPEAKGIYFLRLELENGVILSGKVVRN